jgi:DNA-binding GntR family transcriptional regulator
VQSTTKLDECFIAYLDYYVLPKYVDLEELENFDDGSFLDYLMSKDEHRLTHTSTSIFAVEADEEIAEWLRIDPGKALIHLDETFYTGKGIPVQHGKNYFVSEYMNFHVVRRIVQKP